jgi:hypothetical protein
MATARYSAMQGALAFLGPVMWGSLALDLALKAIGTDYARIIRAVFILAQVGICNVLFRIFLVYLEVIILCYAAQVRLLRTKGFVEATALKSSDVVVAPIAT